MCVSVVVEIQRVRITSWLAVQRDLSSSGQLVTDTMEGLIISQTFISLACLFMVWSVKPSVCMQLDVNCEDVGQM